jgi:uncharacterized protein DUF937
MNTDIISSIASMFGGQTTQKISSLLGEPEDATRAGLRSAMPALLAGLMQKTSDPGGATQLYRTVTGDTVDSGITGKIASLFGNRSNLDSLVTGGESLLGSLLGNRTGAVAHAVSQVSGLKTSSASALLAIGAPVLMGFLKKQVTQGGLDGAGLTSMLLGQRQALQATGLDDRILGALGAGSMQISSRRLHSRAPNALRRIASRTALPTRSPARRCRFHSRAETGGRSRRAWRSRPSLSACCSTGLAANATSTRQPPRRLVPSCASRRCRPACISTGAKQLSTRRVVGQSRRSRTRRKRSASR